MILYENVAMGTGRQAGNPWLLELPDPVTRSSWDNYAVVSMKKADELGISWIAWAWQASSTRTDEQPDSPICTFPMLLKDWGGTPSTLGQLVKDRLASY